MRRTGALLVAIASALLAWGAPAHAAGRCGSHPWCDTSLSPDARAQLLLDALTQDEKVGLLAGDDPFGVGGGAHSHTGTSTGIPRVDLPTTYYSDGPVGPRQGQTTAMPIPMALAATFDPALARLHGSTIANEAKLKGNDVIFAPTVNVMRTPLGGRTFEAYGEDPYLVKALTVGWIDGAQSQGVIANVKHYAANNQEGAPGAAGNVGAPGQPLGPPNAQGNRLTVDSQVDERTLREVYLQQFEAAVKDANVGSIMCSYNRLNGQYACENEHLLHDVLREWGFKGYVLADYGAAHNTVASLNNGLDFEPWPGIAYSPTLVNAALVSGQASPQLVDEHVKRILRTLFAYGFFDRDAFKDDDAQIDKAGHARAAQQVEESAITLLKNSGGALPLDSSKLKSIAVIGSDANRFKTGGGSGNVTPFSFTPPRQAIADRAGPGVSTTYDDGSDADRAAGAAKAADVAVVFAGDYQSEGSDKECLSLECPPYAGDQDALIEKVAAAQPNTIVMLESGGPVLTPWRDKVRALVEAWYPGQEGGPAIARVLFGDTDPGGRLPVTFPKQEGDIPTAGDPEKYPGVGEQVKYKEGLFVGYRWYDARGIQPAFPFGFGLSYTRFSYRKLKLSGRKVSVTVKNTGKRAGTAVPQLYVALGSGEPAKQLRGMRRVTLAPGKSRRVTFRLTPRDLSYWDVGTNAWKRAPGCIKYMVGSSSRAIARTTGRRTKRVFNAHTGLRASRVNRIAVYVNGKRQRVYRGHHRTVKLRLPASGRVRVRMVIRKVTGRIVVRKRVYGECLPR
jgi:beta-glucosidase